MIGEPPSGRLAVSRAFKLLCEAGSLTRENLRRLLRTSPSTITYAVNSLIERDYVVESGRAGSTGGRPAGVLELSPGLGGVLAVDLGGMRMRVAAADLRGELLTHHTVVTPSDPSALQRQLVRALGEVRQELAGPVRASCLSIAGVVDPETGEISMTTNIEGWVGGRAPRWLKKFGEPLLVENEANIAAFGEYQRGAARGCRTALFLALGAGVGSGLIIDGQLFRGANGAAGEIGLARLACDGNSAQLEREVAGPALVARYRSLQGGKVDDPVELFHRARQGDAVAATVIGEALDRLSVAVANAILLVDPERVVVGGGLAVAGDLLVGPLRERVYDLLDTSRPELAISVLGPDAALVGACSLAAQTAVEELASELDG